MGITRVAATLLVLGIAACHSEGSFLLPPTGDLDGSWAWSENRNPGGITFNFTLVTSGKQVTGSGVICGAGGNCLPGPVTVSGRHDAAFAPFKIAVVGKFYRADFAGSFVTPDQIQGTWSRDGSRYTLTMNRTAE